MSLVEKVIEVNGSGLTNFAKLQNPNQVGLESGFCCLYLLQTWKKYFIRFVETGLSAIMQRAPGQPSCFDRIKVGFMIGCAVGMSSAALFGTYAALRTGLRGRELMSSVGKIMVQGGGSFGVFMSIGTAIRC